MVFNQLLVTLSLHNEAMGAVFAENHGRYQIAIVIGCHGESISSRGEYAKDVAGLRQRKGDVLYENISAFAILSAYGNNLRLRQVEFIGNNSMVDGLIKGRADIVSHASIY